MSFQDKSLKCIDCGVAFTFTSGEQDYFASKGFTNEPKRCVPCRKAKKQKMGNSTYGSHSYSPR